MEKPNELFSHSATIFPVLDMARSIDFYKNKMGFEVTFTWEEPITYAVLKRGEVGIHLTQRADQGTPSSEHTALYIFVRDVNAVYRELKEKEVIIRNDIGDRDYRMRDFDIVDPDGYILTFGKGES